jgi:hypothetical protein
MSSIGSYYSNTGPKTTPTWKMPLSFASDSVIDQQRMNREGKDETSAGIASQHGHQADANQERKTPSFKLLGVL